MGLISLAIKASVAKTAIKSVERYAENKYSEKISVYTIYMPKSAREYCGKNYSVVIKELKEIGFQHVYGDTKEIHRNNLFRTNNEVFKVIINGNSEFVKGDKFKSNSDVCVKYYQLI